MLWCKRNGKGVAQEKSMSNKNLCSGGQKKIEKLPCKLLIFLLGAITFGLTWLTKLLHRSITCNVTCERLRATACIGSGRFGSVVQAVTFPTSVN